MERSYKVVDVFTARPLEGNPVAVVLDAQGLDDQAMQSIARWTNLSETTFLLPADAPGADYRLRIFTPRNELPFAGHPTLGSAYAALEAGRATLRGGRLVQECGAGLVNIDVSEEAGRRTLTLDLPPASVSPLAGEDIDEVEAVLGRLIVRASAPAVVNVGVKWVIAEALSAADLNAMTPDFPRSAALEQRLGVAGLTIFAGSGDGGDDVEVRSFAPSSGIDEDPVCGSGNGAVAAFRAARGLLPVSGTRYTARQGRCVRRDGRVEVGVDASGGIKIGGSCVTCVTGILTI